MLSISAASAHENIISDGNNTVNDIICINHFDDGLDDDGLDDDSDLDDYDDSDDWDDDDWDDDDWDDDSDLGDYDDSDDWDDDDWDDDWDDDSDDWDDDSDDWDDDDWDDDDWDDDSDDWDDDDWYYDWYCDDWDDDGDGNYTNSSIKFYKLISYSRNELFLYKTTSSIGNMPYADSGSEEDYEGTGGNDSDNRLDNNSDDWNEDSQEESSLKDLQSFMTACPGASASFEVPDVLSENHGSVSKSINHGQNLLDDEKEGNVTVTGDKNHDTITFSSDDNLGVLGLLVSILLCILLLI